MGFPDTALCYGQERMDFLGQPAISATCSFGLVVWASDRESHCNLEQVTSPPGEPEQAEQEPQLSLALCSDVLQGTTKGAVRPQPLATPRYIGTLMCEKSRHQPKAGDNQMLKDAWHKDEGVNFWRKGTVSGS